MNPSPPPPPQGARLLFSLALLGLVLEAVHLGLLQLLSPGQSPVAALELRHAWNAGLLLLSAANLVALGYFVSQRPAGARAWGWGAVACAAYGVASGAVGLAVEPLAPGAPLLALVQAMAWGKLATGTGYAVAVWFALSGSTSRPAAPAVTASYLTVVGAQFLFSVGVPALDLTRWAVAQGKGAVLALSWTLAGLALARSGALLWLLYRVAFSPDAAAAAVPARPATASPGQRDLWVGATWLAVGLLVTAGSFALGGGGRYVIATGVIAYGLVRLLRGLSRSAHGAR